MQSLRGKNNTTDAAAATNWNDASSPFRIYNNGILYNNALYKSPMHVLVAIVYGTAFFDENVLHNYDSKFIAQNFCQFCAVESDSEFLHHLRKEFCIAPTTIATVINKALDVLLPLLFEQRPLLFVGTSKRLFCPEIRNFYASSKLLRHICVAFAARCASHTSMMPLT